MKILYLCNKNTYDTKMSRIRFHSMFAISKITDLTCSGIGWSNYDPLLTVQDNVDHIYGKNSPDLIIGYKPLELKDFASVNVAKCVRYNEMWDIGWTNKEISNSNADIVICHHKNDMKNYQNIKDKMVNISHCADNVIYKDYGLEKKYDVLFTGAVGKHYPFRQRIRRIIPELKKHVVCKVLGHPGGNMNKPRGLILKDYAKLINSSKITLTCSSRYKYRLGKYVEIPMCGSIIAADLPDEDQDFFEKFMLVINPKMNDEEIVDKILTCLKDKGEMDRRVSAGIELNKEYTQEKYAERFVRLVGEKL
jgi:hypothetical protein